MEKPVRVLVTHAQRQEADSRIRLAVQECPCALPPGVVLEVIGSKVRARWIDDDCMGYSADCTDIRLVYDEGRDLTPCAIPDDAPELDLLSLVPAGVVVTYVNRGPVSADHRFWLIPPWDRVEVPTEHPNRFTGQPAES